MRSKRSSILEKRTTRPLYGPQPLGGVEVCRYCPDPATHNHTLCRAHTATLAVRGHRVMITFHEPRLPFKVWTPPFDYSHGMNIDVPCFHCGCQSVAFQGAIFVCQYCLQWMLPSFTRFICEKPL